MRFLLIKNEHLEFKGKPQKNPREKARENVKYEVKYEELLEEMNFKLVEN